MLTPTSLAGGPKAIAANILKSFQAVQQELRHQNNTPQDLWKPNSLGQDTGIALNREQESFVRNFRTPEPGQADGRCIEGKRDMVKHQIYPSGNVHKGESIKEWFYRDEKAADTLVFKRMDSIDAFRVSTVTFTLSETGLLTREFSESDKEDFRTGVTFNLDEQFLVD